MKICTVCNKPKPLDQYYNSKSYKDGKGYRCKDCDYIARKEYEKKNLDSMKRARKLAQVKYKYNLSPTDFDLLVAKHDSHCGICKKYYKHLSIDHDHKTGVVRGMLCPDCNRGLGLFRDSIEIIESAINYLEKKSG